MLYFTAIWTLVSVVCRLTDTVLPGGLEHKHFCKVGRSLVIALWLGVVPFSIVPLSTSLIFPLSLLLAVLIATSSTSQGVRSRWLIPPPFPNVEILEKQINDVAFFFS
jgi:hypothetical protein